MQCNIDARGKSVRLVMGVLVLKIGLILAILRLFSIIGPWTWYAVAACALAGGFAVFEARAGWCALRAMGIKTPV